MKLLHSMWMRGWDSSTDAEDIIASKDDKDFGMLSNHWLMWFASTLFARRSFGNIHLFGDSCAARVCEDMAFPYTSMSSSADILASRKIPPELYAYAKILNYRQDEPFLHIDWDVFVMKPLPLDFINSGVVCQQPECETWISTYQGIYRSFVRTMPSCPISWLQCSPRACPYNAGIIGGTDLVFWDRYVDEIDSVLSQEGIHTMMNSMSGWERSMCMFLLEQYTVGSLADTMGIDIQSLLQGHKEGHKELWGCKTGREVCRKYGYAHLLDEKNHPIGAWQSSDFFGRLHRRLQEEFPVEYNEFMERLYVKRRNVVGKNRAKHILKPLETKYFEEPSPQVIARENSLSHPDANLFSVLTKEAEEADERAK